MQSRRPSPRPAGPPSPTGLSLLTAMLVFAAGVGLAVSGASSRAVADRVGTAYPPQCLALADEWCNSAAYDPDCPLRGGGQPNLTALFDTDAQGGAKAWRCYSPKCLNANHSAYIGHGCTDYCTRAELAGIVKNCKLPPAPPPPPPPPVPQFLAEVFTPGMLGYPCIRIPSILLHADGKTLNAFAECRNFTGDGCLPVAHRDTGADGSSNRDLCQRQSVDGGKTWLPLQVIAHNGAQASPVYDSVRDRILLQYMQLSPAATMQMTSEDGGATWSKPVNVCPQGLSPDACGGAVGPEVGIQLTQGQWAGRLLFIGHFGAYVKDIVWYSDDGGDNWSVSNSTLRYMDEAQLVELPDGTVMANMRNAHLNASCDCRAVAVSRDGGTTFGEITYDPALVSPVCMASIMRSRSNGEIYFANPASAVGRVNGTIRRSVDGVNWEHSVQVFAGEYGYSCLTDTPDPQTIGVLWESDGPQCRPGSASCRTLFSVVPLDF